MLNKLKIEKKRTFLNYLNILSQIINLFKTLLK